MDDLCAGQLHSVDERVQIGWVILRASLHLKHSLVRGVPITIDRVTHLAQVAAQAHAQFRVTKLTDGKLTRTAVKPLTREERVDEIARMSGGINISEQARAHAREMLAAAGSSGSAESSKKKRSPASRR